MPCHQVSSFNGKSEKKMTSYLQGHPIPAVLGPENTFHPTDHHHLLCALELSTYKGSDVCVVKPPYVPLP
jgi:hypothetical protein